MNDDALRTRRLHALWFAIGLAIGVVSVSGLLAFVTANANEIVPAVSTVFAAVLAALAGRGRVGVFGSHETQPDHRDRI